jgi:hypothetical protein
VATKSPGHKTKKTAAKDSAPKKAAAPKPREAEPDEDEDEDEAPAAPVATKKPTKGKAAAAEAGDPPAVVPARRLTPEAKAQVNAMVQKGVPLGEALKMAASWETFVAPVKEEPAKLVQGRPSEGGPRPQFRREEEDDESSESDGEADGGED